MSEQEIKPCLCGGEMEVDARVVSPYFWLVCQECGDETQASDSKTEAIAAHNAAYSRREDRENEKA